MGEIVKIGIVGTSWWTDRVHLPCLASHPKAKVAAICGRNQIRAGEMARKYSIPGVFTDYREMIARGGLDALVIAVPDDLHCPVAMEALDAGLHVLCEKPLALHAADAKAMYEKAKSAVLMHMTFFTYRWMPWYRHVRRLIEQGFLGTCHQCSIRYLAAYGLSRKYAWRFDRARSNGVLGDLGSHMIDLARWLVGDVSGVCGRLATFVARDAPDRNALDPANDAAILALQFANGALGTIQVSAVAETAERGQEQHVVLHGEKGTIEVDVHTASGVEIRTVRSGGKLSLEPIPDELMGNADRTKPVLNRAMEMFMTESIGDRLFIDAILEGKPVEPSLFDGYKAQLVIDAAIESHAKGRWISPE